MVPGRERKGEGEHDLAGPPPPFPFPEGTPVSETAAVPAPAGTRAQAAPGTKLGVYEVTERIGHGGAGIVLRARAPDGREVAIKLLKAVSDESSLARFKRERRLLVALGELEGFVPIIDDGLSPHGPFLVMPFVAGGSLEQRLGQGPMPVDESVDLGVALAGAMALAHERGIVHRDLKPGNVLLSPARGEAPSSGPGLHGARPLIADLGLAKHFRHDPTSDVASATPSTDGTFLGTPAYMAPEQMKDARAVGPPADVYALGAILYECLAGRPAIVGGSVLDVIRRVRSGAIEPLEKLRPDVPAWLSRIVASALSRNPWERPESARALARALEARGGQGADRASFALRAAARAGKTNLAPEPTSFVGRRADLSAVHQLFLGGERLVTLIGPAGSGKTRLATCYGAIHAEGLASEGGVWLCEVAPARTLAALLGMVSSALGVPLTRGATIGDGVLQLGQALAGRGPLLVILDGLEPSLEQARAALARWLELASLARFLVTSAEPLRLPGESVLELPPLSLPEGDGEETSEAEELFFERSSGRLERERERPLVAEIVRRLSGSPLAIELVAASALSPASALERLPRGPSEGSRALRAALDIAFAALPVWEKAALSQCAVFSGSFTLDAAESVVDLSGFPEATLPAEVLRMLRSKHLVRSREPGALESRDSLHESVRSYAREKLDAAGASEAALARHAAHFLRAGAAWAEAVEASGDLAGLRQLAAEREDILAVLERALEAPRTCERARDALASAVVLASLLSRRGPAGALLGILDAALARAQVPGRDAALGTRALVARAAARQKAGRLAEARSDLDAAAASARETADAGLEATVCHARAMLDAQQGRHDEARSMLEAQVAAARERGDRAAGALLESGLAQLHHACGRLHDAREAYLRALEAARETGDRGRECAALVGASAVLSRERRIGEARESFEQALEVARESGDLAAEAFVVASLAEAHLEEGHIKEARLHVERGHRLARWTGNADAERHLQLVLGKISTDEGRLEQARGQLERALAFPGASRSHASSCHGALADIHRAQGRLTEAARHCEAAAALSRESGDRPQTALHLSSLAAVLAAPARTTEAEAALTAASEVLAQDPDPVARAIASVSRGHVELAKCREAMAQGRAAEARALWESARRRGAAAESGADGLSLAAQSRALRVALRFLKAALGSEGP